MPTRIFAITAARETVILDNQGRAEVSFTASNTAPKSIAGQAKLVAIGSTKEAWLTLDGEPERKFAKGESHQFTVRIAVPPGTPTGNQVMRLSRLVGQRFSRLAASCAWLQRLTTEARGSSPMQAPPIS